MQNSFLNLNSDIAENSNNNDITDINSESEIDINSMN